MSFMGLFFIIVCYLNVLILLLGCIDSGGNYFISNKSNDFVLFCWN